MTISIRQERAARFPIEPAPKPKPMTEAQLGAEMLKAAMQEGHKKGLPPKVAGSRDELKDGTRGYALVSLLRERPRSVSDLANIFGDSANTRTIVNKLRAIGYVIEQASSSRGSKYRLISEPEGGK